MIKGINKRVIIIKNPESEMFEEAHFFLKNTKGIFKTPKENDMVSEANKLLMEYHAQQHSSSKKSESSVQGFSADEDEGAGVVAVCGSTELIRAETHEENGSHEKLRSMIRVLSSRNIKSRNMRLILGGFLFGVSSMSAVIIIVRLAQYLLGR